MAANITGVHSETRKSHSGFLILLLLGALLLAGAIYYELIQRQTQRRALASSVTDGAGGPLTVNVGRVMAAQSAATVEIPGQTVALIETPIYARTDGYLKQRPVDIGMKVKKGDLLIELETPDLDQQIAQARATLAQSHAALEQLRAALVSSQSNLKLAQVTADRWKKLTSEGVVAQQDLDTKVAQLEAGQAGVRASEENIRAQQSLIEANEASLKRLQDQKSYARMEAPFDGVITFRNPIASDVGTLISSGSSTSSREILRVSQVETLRIFVNVPQNYAAQVREGGRADVALDEFPGRVFPAVVKSTTHSVDPVSRTLLAVLLVDNAKETLMPGMYAKARFHLPHTVSVLRLPAEALVFRTEGPQAAVIGVDHKVHFHNLTLGRDYGAQVEVTSGVEADDMVVLNPTDTIRENVVVEPNLRK